MLRTHDDGRLMHYSRHRPRWISLLRDTAVIVVVALTIAFVARTFVVRTFSIPSGSMKETLEVGDRILVDELTPHLTGLRRGDVIVFTDPGGWLGEPAGDSERPWWVHAGEWMLSLIGLATPDSEQYLVKRVIGLPGDHVTCCDKGGRVSVNGVAIDESPYLRLIPGESSPSRLTYDVIVPKGSLWVLGDNRDFSIDSRWHQAGPTKGFVPVARVAGRAFVVSWPLGRVGLVDGQRSVFAGVPNR